MRGSPIRSRLVILLKRSSRASSSTGKYFLMRPPPRRRRRCATVATPKPIEPGPAMPPASSISFWSAAWCATARSTSSGVSMSDWIIISPSRQSSNSSCRMKVKRADRRGVGDAARVVQVERVRGDEVRDEHPVDADELLDRQLRRLGFGQRVDEADHGVVGGHASAGRGSSRAARGAACARAPRATRACSSACRAAS